MKPFNRKIAAYGEDEVINSIAVKVLLESGSSKDSNILICTGLTKPTDGSDGFAKGCLFIKTDAASGTKGLYENQGTKTSCIFNIIGDISSAEI